MKKVILKSIILSFLLLVVFLSDTYGMTTDPSSGPYYSQSPIRFRPNTDRFGNVYYTNWNFGDGSPIYTGKGSEWVSHTFTSPGIYTVSVTGYMYQTGGDTEVTDSTTILVENEGQNRYIQADPAEVVVGQPSTYTLFNAYTPNNIRWDMGDGTILSGRYHGGAPGARNWVQSIKMKSRGGMKGGNATITGTNVVSHTYAAAGSYTIRAYDFDGNTQVSPVTYNVTVRMPSRSITVSPSNPLAGAPVQYTAVNFLSTQVDWTFGDGNTVSGGSATVTHIYNSAGSYTVTARERDMNYTPISIRVTVAMPNRQISVSPRSPRVDQTATFRTVGYLTNAIDWNFGDGTIVTGGTTSATHRYQTAGTYIVSARDATIDHPVVNMSVTVLPENRYITVTPPEARANETITAQAFNFRGDFIYWDFGDGTTRTGGQTETYAYTRAGRYTITAYDENGESQIPFTANIAIRGIDAEVNLEIAEVKLDNGKYYKVVPLRSKNIYAILRMKMRGTGILSGYWLVNGSRWSSFNRMVSQGRVEEIKTSDLRGLPTITPGLHQVSIQLTQPTVEIAFPVLKYLVLPYEKNVTTLSPSDGFIAKEKEVPVFSWEEAKGAVKYQVAFCNFLYPILKNLDQLRWYDVKKGTLSYTPGKEAWSRVKRNRWTYWKVRAMDTVGNVVAESDVQDIKLVVGTAEVTIDKVTDLDGKDIVLADNNITTHTDDLLVQGSVTYHGESKFLVLRVFVENQLTDQLLFRDVKKDEKRFFETSIPNRLRKSKVFFQVLKTSSPAIIVGLKGITLKR